MTLDEALILMNKQASFISVKNIWQKLKLRVLLHQHGITPFWMDHRKNLCLIYFYGINEYQFVSTSPQALKKMGYYEIPYDSITTIPVHFDYDKLL